MGGASSGGGGVDQQVFAKGSLVEVRSDEEGFDDAWYVATIVETPAKSVSQASKKKNPNSNKYCVQYQSLLDDDGVTPLREHLHFDFLRPLPPSSETDSAPSFELYDIVDAFYRDGWWTGVITKVLENSKFVVYFQNPPEEIEFGLPELRIHREWIADKWVRPGVQRKIGLMFSTEGRAEVSFDKEDYRDAWFPATVLEYLGNSCFLVEYQNVGNDKKAGLQKVIVDSRHIRPCPPPLNRRHFVVLEKVDAFHNFGWWSGFITKGLVDGRYIVYFKHRNKVMEFTQKILRPHMEWTDGKWIPASKDIFIQPDATKDNSGERIPGSINVVQNHTEQSTLGKGKPSSYNAASSRKERKRKDPDHNASLLWNSKKLQRGNALKKPSQTLSETKSMSMQTPSKENLSNFSSPATGGTGTYSSKESLVGNQHYVKTQCSPWGNKVDVNHIFLEEINQLDSGKNSQQKRRGRPPKLVIKSPCSMVADKKQTEDAIAADAMVAKDRMTNEVELPKITSKEVDLPKNTEAGTKKLPEDPTKCKSANSTIKMSLPEKDKRTNEKVVQTSRKQFEKPPSKRGRRRSLNVNIGSPGQDSQDRSGRKRVEGFGTSILTKPVGKAISALPSCISDDQPLLTWSRAMSSLTTFDGLSERHRESGLQAAAVDGNCELQADAVDGNYDLHAAAVDGNSVIVPDPSGSLPFVKTFPWKMIESLEVFQVMPQKPHFQPLRSFKENSREGLAVACMVSFSRVVKRTAQLQFDEPRGCIEDCLDTLVELESHGFDVKKLRDRLTRLLLLKDRQELLQDKLKELETQIVEHKNENTETDLEIDEINKKIQELQEHLALAMSKKETKDSKIATLQSSIHSINEGINSIRLDFEKLAAGPWGVRLLPNGNDA